MFDAGEFGLELFNLIYIARANEENLYVSRSDHVLNFWLFGAVVERNKCRAESRSGIIRLNELIGIGLQRRNAVAWFHP